MTHWKHTATRCAMPTCEQTRRKGWTTCAYYGHAERGVSLYGLAPKAPRLKPVLDASGAVVPDIGQEVMHYTDYDIGVVCDRVEYQPGQWRMYVRWVSDAACPMVHSPDELLDPPAITLDSHSDTL